MAADELVVRVVLDTSQAKGELADLTREGERASGGIGAKLRSAVGRGLGLVGLGAAVGAGIEAVRGATSSGVSDVVGEALGGIGAQISEFFLGDLNENARASRAAREETIQNFGFLAGARGQIPPGAKAFFDSVKSLRVQEERGRELFQLDPSFRGPSIGDLVDRIMSGIAKLLSDAVDALADKLNPFK